MVRIRYRITLTFSSLEDYAKCPKYFDNAHRTILKNDAAKIAADFGNLLHDKLEEFKKNQKDSESAPLPYVEFDNKRYSESHAQNLLAAFSRVYPKKFPDGTMFEETIYKDFPMKDGNVLRLRGTLDVKRPEDKMADYKTTSFMLNDSINLVSAQAPIYCTLAGLNEVLFIYFNTQVTTVKENDWESKITEFNRTVTEEEKTETMGRVLEQAEKVLESHLNNNFPKTLNHAICGLYGGCPFIKNCTIPILKVMPLDPLAIRDRFQIEEIE